MTKSLVLITTPIESACLLYEHKFDAPRLMRVFDPKCLSVSLFCLDSSMVHMPVSQCHHKITYPSAGSSLRR